MFDFTFERLKVENGAIYTESEKSVARMDRSEEATKAGISPVERDCNAHRFVFLWNQAMDTIDPSIKRIKKVCKKCGSDEVKVDAFAYWNEVTQDWDIVDIFPPDFYCDGCEGDAVAIRDEPIDGVWDKQMLEELPQESLDNKVHDLKGYEASTINNAGRDAQIEYLLGGDDVTTGDDNRL